MARFPFIALSLLLLGLNAGATAAVPVDVLDVDLAPLIERSAKKREYFAVNVPYVASAETRGRWSTTGSAARWTWRVQVPTAVSLSFNAPQVRLPDGARLTVTGEGATVVYTSDDARNGSLWGRPLRGDTLQFTLTVDAKERSRVQFVIAGLQAGYRGLSRDVPDHAYYKALQTSAGALSAACTQNYACNADDANSGPAQATVAVLIGNVAQCTGTLLNNTRGDARPFVLTARHCQTGDLAGGNPGIASSVTIYWEAVSACGQVLGSLYEDSTTTQTGAITRVEQQDAWLLELVSVPRIALPYFAGWDAGGAAFTGGYSVHHALGGSKQFTRWSGTAHLHRVQGSVVQAPYDLDFWGVVNSLGNVGSGASGGALFDPAHRVVGSASLAYIDGDGDGVCPAVPVPVPSLATVTAQYTALSGVWNSTADPSSSTGNATLRSFLDPDATGQMAIDGFGYRPLTLTVSDEAPRTDGNPITLTWNASWAQTCTASGGRDGDGWAGERPAAGSAQVMDFAGGNVEYRLSCTGPGLRGNASRVVQWTYITPYVTLVGPAGPVIVGNPFELRWDGNVQPCTASDGVTGDGWAGGKPQNSQQTLMAMQPGLTTYQLTCGTGQRVAAAQVDVSVVAPSVAISANATRVRIGSWIDVRWSSPAQSGRCDGSGGTPNWALNNTWVQPNGGSMATSDVPGIFTFTMTCGSGADSASSSVDVEFVDEPPAISLAAIAPQHAIHPSGPIPPLTTANLLWSSNVTPCSLRSEGPFGMGNKLVQLLDEYPFGTAIASEHIAATYEYVLACGDLEARATIEWIAPTPTITLSDSEESGGAWIAGRQYGLRSRTNALPCIASGGAPGDGWAGRQDFAPNNSVPIDAPREPGTYTYTLNCGSGISAGTGSYVVTIQPPAVTLTTSVDNPAAGQYIRLAWESNTELCSANADGAGVSWGPANMNASAFMLITQPEPGTYAYTISCGVGAHMAHASKQVTFRAGPANDLRASHTSANVNTPVTLTWEVGGTVCSGVGGVSGDGWSGPQPPNGSLVVTSPIPQIVGYALNCDVGGAMVQVEYTGVEGGVSQVPRPSTSLSASHQSRVVGDPITLTWTSQHAGECQATGGAGGDGWAGSVSLSGSMNVTRLTPGDTTYTVTCTGATPASTSQVVVSFAAAPGGGGGGGGGSGSSSGGGGGGGRLDYLLLVLLALATLSIAGRRCPGAQPRPPAITGGDRGARPGISPTRSA